METVGTVEAIGQQSYGEIEVAAPATYGTVEPLDEE